MARRTAPPSSRRLVAFAVTATLLLWVGLATAATTTAARTANPGAGVHLRQATDDDLRLELLEQDLAVEANGTIRLLYRLSGDLAGTADLSPPTTTTLLGVRSK